MYICNFCGRQSKEFHEECRGCGSTEFMPVPEKMPTPPAYNPHTGGLPQNLSCSTAFSMATCATEHTGSPTYDPFDPYVEHWYKSQDAWKERFLNAINWRV